MHSIKTILLTLSAITAGTSATRADDMSNLVAAVAASMEKQHIEKDALHNRLDSEKPRYSPKPKTTDLSIGMLDGILSSMKREKFRSMQRDIYDVEDQSLDLQDAYIHPTLGRPGFFRPVPGVITSNFGWRPSFNRMHHGVDLALQVGDTVRASLSGTVELIAYDHEGYGHYVMISHPDGMETVYGHLEYALVGQGQFVYAGQPVGIGGNTGNSTGPHLHFEARLGGVAVDPTLIFDFYGTPIYIEDEIPPAMQKGPVYSHQSKSLKKESTYIVRFGDTLESIARQAGIPVMRLCQLNMLQQSEAPQVGRMLKLK